MQLRIIFEKVMKQLAFAFIFILSCLPVLLFSQEKNISTETYIATYKQFAIEEMQKYGIPASITLAQGIVETGSGNSELARNANNHFGIKCKSEWTGEKYYYDDDEKQECFRKYPSAEASYRDHSVFLKTRPYYTSLFSLKPGDYKGWAHGLKKAGYATNPAYAEMLIRVIEDYKLWVYDGNVTTHTSVDTTSVIQADTAGIVRVVETVTTTSVDTLRQKIASKTQGNSSDDFNEISLSESPRKLYIINGVRFVKALKRDKTETIAADFSLAPFDVLRYNDMPKNHQLSEGEIVFIEPKKKSCETEFHIVQAGETMWGISQKYGIQLDVLYHRNRIKKGNEPGVGQKIWLRNNSPAY